MSGKYRSLGRTNSFSFELELGAPCEKPFVSMKPLQQEE
jgi:hypothetical protein